jgi:hypothetical protein
MCNRSVLLAEQFKVNRACTLHDDLSGQEAQTPSTSVVTEVSSIQS